MTDVVQMRRDPALFGARQEPGLIAVEHATARGCADRALLFFRRDGQTVEEQEPLQTFVVTEGRLARECPVPAAIRELAGNAPLNTCLLFESWAACLKARDWLVDRTGCAVNAPEAPFVFLNDPVHQHLLLTGRTSFMGLRFEDLRRMQVDIECRTTEGFEFCNPEREGDAVLAIAMADQTGWVEVASAREGGERHLLERFVRAVQERDPDVIEGHNLFNFDLPYLAERARRHGVKLALGRHGEEPRRRPSRWSAGERTIAYERFEIPGRHVVDTLFLVHAYDIAHRSLDGFGLKEAAIHFGLASDSRTYIEGSEIGRAFDRDPELVLRYARDDVVETRGLSDLLSRSHFIQAQMLPYAYQNVCVRGTATKVDALMIREYLRRGAALPLPDAPREFEGGYTDLFVEGVVREVHHCDVRSLYPSLMLKNRVKPASDELGVFLDLLRVLRDFRLEVKTQAGRARDERERLFLDAMQTTFKVLINSFYGYLGFSQARFSDYRAAEDVTRGGRDLLKAMIETIRRLGGTPVEIDTDGIYFVPPENCRTQPTRPVRCPEADAALAAFREAFASTLPEGIEVEFDGEYRSMYSYRMKNYALLTQAGEMIIKGAALKSRGLERFQREFLRDAIRLRLEGREGEIPLLLQRHEQAIAKREWDVRMLAKTETLQDAPSTYASKLSRQGRARSAAYELALASGREYRAGDQVSYYVTGEKKTVTVHDHAKLVSAWNPEARDENVAYYMEKLRALNAKFGTGRAKHDQAAELDLGLGNGGPGRRTR